MYTETKVISTLDETAAHNLIVLEASGVYLVGEGGRADTFLKAVANALVSNGIDNPVFEIEGSVELRVSVPCLAAVAGHADVEVNGRRCSAWRALPVPAGGRVRVSVKKGVACLAFSGLRGRLGHVEPGARFALKPVEGCDGDLAARYVPLSLVHSYFNDGAREDILAKTLRHIRLACEMARRGAKLVKVKVRGKIFDLWVEEVE